MSISRAQCKYVGSYVNACDAIPQALQRIVSYEHESRMQDRDTRDFIARTVESFRGSGRRGDTDGECSPQMEADLARLKSAFQNLRKQYREKVSLAEQAQQVLEEWKRNLQDAHTSNIEVDSLLKLAKTDPYEAAALLHMRRKEIPADQPEVKGSKVVVSAVTEEKLPSHAKAPMKVVDSVGVAKPKIRTPVTKTNTALPKSKLGKRPAEKPLAAPVAKKPKVTAQTSQPGTDTKVVSKKAETSMDKKKKKTTAKKEASPKEENWMRLYKNAPWKGSGKLPPLCGPAPASPTYIIPSGNFVAAKNPSKSGEAPSWMVASIIRYVPTKRIYEVEDVDAEEARASKKGTKMTVQRDDVIPLPLQMPDWQSNKEFPVGRKVIALYPKTTCFYEGKVIHTPSMCRANHYLVEFMDDDDEDEEGGKRVAHALVLDYPMSIQKALNF